MHYLQSLFLICGILLVISLLKRKKKLLQEAQGCILYSMCPVCPLQAESIEQLLILCIKGCFP